MKKLNGKAGKLLDASRKKNLTIATAESCTGGLLAAVLTGIPGASDVFERGFVTYANAAKTEMLGVSAGLIEKHGAVSREVAEAMARGALKHSRADMAVAITGIAGPGGGSKKKPVGRVYIAAALRAYEDAVVLQCDFKGKRDAVRRRSVDKALGVMKKLLAFF